MWPLRIVEPNAWSRTNMGTCFKLIEISFGQRRQVRKSTPIPSNMSSWGTLQGIFQTQTKILLKEVLAS